MVLFSKSFRKRFNSDLNRVQTAMFYDDFYSLLFCGHIVLFALMENILIFNFFILQFLKMSYYWRIPIILFYLLCNLFPLLYRRNTSFFSGKYSMFWTLYVAYFICSILRSSNRKKMQKKNKNNSIKKRSYFRAGSNLLVLEL